MSAFEYSFVIPDDEDEFEKKAREKIEIGEEELSGGDEDSEAKATKVNLHIFVIHHV